MSDPARGEIWWGETPEEKGRPYLVITRDEAIPVMRTLLVAPVTRTVRGIATELPVGAPEGLPAESVAAMDAIFPVRKSMLTRRMGRLEGDRIHELCASIRAAVDC